MSTQTTISMPGGPRTRQKRIPLTVNPVTRNFALDGSQGCTNIRPTKDMGEGLFLKSRACALHKGDCLVPKKDTYYIIKLKTARQCLPPLWYIEFGKFAIVLRDSYVHKTTIYHINSSAGESTPNVEYRYNRSKKNQLYLVVLKTIEPGTQLLVRYDPDNNNIFDSKPSRK